MHPATKKGQWRINEECDVRRSTRHPSVMAHVSSITTRDVSQGSSPLITGTHPMTPRQILLSWYEFTTERTTRCKRAKHGKPYKVHAPDIRNQPQSCPGGSEGSQSISRPSNITQSVSRVSLECPRAAQRGFKRHPRSPKEAPKVARRRPKASQRNRNL